MLKQLWSEHRNACLLTLALLVIGFVVSPWVLLAALVPIGWVIFNGRSSDNYKPEQISIEEDEMSPILKKSESGFIDGLIGIELLLKVDSLGDISKSDIVRQCGYVSKKEDGDERLEFNLFYEALLDAKTFYKKNKENKNYIKKKISWDDIFSEKDCDEGDDKIIDSWDSDKPLLLVEQPVISESSSVQFSNSQYNLLTYVVLNASTPDYIIDLLKDNNELKYAKKFRELPRELIINEVRDGSEINYNRFESTLKYSLGKDKPHASSITLGILSKNKDPKIRKAVAQNKYTPKKIIEYLIGDKDEQVKYEAKKALEYIDLIGDWYNMGTEELVVRIKSEEIINENILDFYTLPIESKWMVPVRRNCQEEDIEAAIALRENIPNKIRDRLNSSDRSEVRFALKCRELPKEWRSLNNYQKVRRLESEENIDGSILEILSHCSDEYNGFYSNIKETIAKRDDCPIQILDKLENDSNREVRFLAKLRTKRLPAEWSIEEDEDFIADKIDQDKDIDLNVLDVFSDHSSDSVKAAVGRHMKTPKYIESRLYSEESDSVRCYIVLKTLPIKWQLASRNIYSFAKEMSSIIDNEDSINNEILETLNKCPCEEVKRSIIVKELPKESQEVAKRIINRDYSDSLLADFINKNIPASSLQRLAELGFWSKAIVSHPNTSIEVLESYLKDDDELGINNDLAIIKLTAIIRLSQLPKETYLMEFERIAQLISNDKVLIEPFFNQISNIRNPMNFESVDLIKQAISYHPNISKETIEILINNESFYIIFAAICANKLPREWRFLDSEELLIKIRENEIENNLLDIISRSHNDNYMFKSIKEEIISKENISPIVLKNLLRDKDMQIRRLAADKLLPDEWKDKNNDLIFSKLSEENISKELIELLYLSNKLNIAKMIKDNNEQSISILKILLEVLLPDDIVYKLMVENFLLRHEFLPISWKGIDEDEIIDRLKGPNIDIDILEILLKYKSRGVLKALALSPSTPSYMHEKLSTNSDATIRRCVAYSTTSKKLIMDLFYDKEPYVREIAKEKLLPEEWRYLMTEDLSEKIKDSFTPNNILEYLSNTDNKNILISILRKPNISVSLIREIENNYKFDYEVLKEIAKNPNTPDSIIEILRRHDSQEINSAIKDRILPLKLRYLNKDELITAIIEEEMKESLLLHFSEHSDYELREAVLKNNNISISILKNLANDSTGCVTVLAKKKLKEIGEIGFEINWKDYTKPNSKLDKSEPSFHRLMRESIDSEILNKLSSSEDTNILIGVACNSNSPDEAIKRIEKYQDDYGDPDIANALESRSLPDEWRFTSFEEKLEKLKASEINKLVIEQLSKSEEWELRKAIALHPSTPKDILQELLIDYDSDIQAAAKQTLKERGLLEED